MEANVYIDLNVAGGLPDTGDGPGHERWTTLDEGQDSWTVRFDGPDEGPRRHVEIVVSFESEYEARREEMTFGAGSAPSELIDAGQWSLLSTTYARRIIGEDLAATAGPIDEERFQSVVRGWTLALDAAMEVVKFLPDESDEVPVSAFWTDMGARARLLDRGRFTREGLHADVTTYQDTLEDFIRRNGGRVR